MANDFWILLAMVIYFAAMLSIGFIYSKRSNSSSKEYFAGGRGVGPWLTALSAEIILVFFSVYVGSCFVTVGKLFATLFGFDYHVMMIIGAVVVFVYTVVGGYLSVVMTDFIQGMLMFFALAVVFIGTVASAGGVDNTVEFRWVAQCASAWWGVR